MAYIDVLSPDSYGQYNRKLAKLTNLATAVYWSEILGISTKVVKKKKYDSDGYFKLDREYIAERTTISLEEQLDCDAILSNLGVLGIDETDPCRVRVYLSLMVEILADEKIQKTDFAKKKTKLTKTQAAANKKAGIIITMKRCLSETDPMLRALYESWVDSVYAAKYFLTKDLIRKFETGINEYSSDLKIKEELLNIAIASGYNNFDWVRSRYKGEYKSTNNIVHLQESRVASADSIDQENSF